MIEVSCEQCNGRVTDPDEADYCANHDEPIVLHSACPCPDHGFEYREPVTEPDNVTE